MGKKKIATIFYVHWQEAELEARIAPLLEKGYDVIKHFQTNVTAKFSGMPDLFVLSLDRLPSHSRAYASWIYEAKKRQPIPVIFVDGQPDKVAQTKEKFPQAIYCKSEGLIPAIEKIISSHEK